jgi:hypothetical protein
MASTADHYLRDLGCLIRERALEAKAESHRDRSDYFAMGRLTGYHEVVSLMQHQAAAFQIPLEQIALEGLDPERDLL